MSKLKYYELGNAQLKPSQKTKKKTEKNSTEKDRVTE